ncbi:Smr/MutS family protein [Solimonas terrae]|uniref:Smr/MutS family protein n=1 Tax=Solimonas terrae TaxID=1396819 RepID=UPI00344C8E73
MSDDQSSKAPDDDTDLFRLAMLGVRPHRPTARALADKPEPAPIPRQRLQDELEVLRELLADTEPDEIESGDTLLYRSAGVQDAVLRRLRRGHYRIESELDLHGHNRDRARLAVVQFLARCHERDLRCVRIIHGKGNGSPNSGPVLKALLGSWLRRRKDVIAYCSARVVDGGTGAIYVLLRAR